MKNKKSFRWVFLSFLLSFLFIVLTGCEFVETDFGVNDAQNTVQETIKERATEGTIEGERYSSKEEVAEYLCRYDELPINFLTKKEAAELGWDNSKGNLWDVTDEGSIGGDYFGNREGLLPTNKGRKYYEADINYQGGYRNAERIIFSNDGLIFYTDDHYSTFEQLYVEGEEECN